MSSPAATSNVSDAPAPPQRTGQDAPTAAAARLRITRRKGACDVCREKKVRCDGKTPCSTCASYDRECHYPADISRHCRRMWRAQHLQAGVHRQRMQQNAVHRQLGRPSPSLMPHYGRYGGDDTEMLLPTYSLYDGEYLSSAWPNAGPFMDPWPDHASAPDAHFMVAGMGPLMTSEVPAGAQPVESDEYTIVVHQTPPEAAANSEFEDLYLETGTLTVGTPSPGQHLRGDTLDELGSSPEAGGGLKSPCPSPGDLFLNLGTEDDTIAARAGPGERETLHAASGTAPGAAAENGPEGEIEGLNFTTDLCGLPELIAHNVGGSSGTEILQIFDHLRSVLFGPYPNNGDSGTSSWFPSSLRSFGTEVKRAPVPWWINESDDRLRRWNDASLAVDIPLVGDLLSPEDVRDLVRSARQPRADPTIVVCSNALFAVGYYCATKAENPRASATSEPLLDSFRRLNAAVSSYTYLWEAPTSLAKLQGTLLTTDTKHASIASICDLACMGPLLASAACCLRELRLVGPQASMVRRRSSPSRSLLAEKCVQIFFCLDSWYSFHQGVATLLDHDPVVSTLSAVAVPKSDSCGMMAVELSFARLTRHIFDFHVNVERIVQDTSASSLELGDMLKLCQQKLDLWYKNLPSPLNQTKFHEYDIRKEDKRPAPHESSGTSTSSQHGPTELRVFLSFHGARLLIHCPLMAILYGPRSAGLCQQEALEELRLQSLEQCVESASFVLKAADGFVAEDTVVQRDTIRLVLLSLSVICFDLVRGNRDPHMRATLSLGYCYSVLGRIRPDDEEAAALLIESTLDLIRIVRSTRRPGNMRGTS